jgi:hypothetical protein
MRLPQSLNRSLFFRTFHFLTNFLTIGTALPLLGIALATSSTAVAQLACTPAKLQFGAVSIGQTETLLVSVTNNGQTTATISGITVRNSVFTTSSLPLPFALPAGQSVDFSVSLTPTAPGWVGGAITLSSDASNPSLQLQAAGAGVNSEAVTASPAAASLGPVPIGTVSTTQVVLTNARSWRVSLSGIQVTGNGFSASGPTFPLTLAPGQSVTLNVAFLPQSAGTSGGRIFVSGPQLVIPLTGTVSSAGQLTPNPASLSFGSVQVGSNQTLYSALTNTGASNVTISSATATGTGFSLSGLAPPLTLNPGASVTFSAVFAPTSPAAASGSIVVTSNAANQTSTVSLSGTGTAQGQLILTPASLNFGNATVGTTVSQPGSISASGTSVTVSSASLGSTEFALSGISLPLTIPAGQSVPFTLTFAPLTTGSASASLSVTSNAGNTPTETLSGVGTAPLDHSVALTWTDTGSGIVGYNVYRGTVTGGPYSKINSALDATAAYSDTSVTAGQTYYYIATAVDGSGVESPGSSEIQAVISTP